MIDVCASLRELCNRQEGIFIGVAVLEISGIRGNSGKEKRCCLFIDICSHGADGVMHQNTGCCCLRIDIMIIAERFFCQMMVDAQCHFSCFKLAASFWETGKFAGIRADTEVRILHDMFVPCAVAFVQKLQVVRQFIILNQNIGFFSQLSEHSYESTG